MPEERFWHLTEREYDELHAVYLEAHGKPRPLTKAQKERLAWNQMYIAEQQRKAKAKVKAKQQLKIESARQKARARNGR